MPLVLQAVWGLGSRVEGYKKYNEWRLDRHGAAPLNAEQLPRVRGWVDNFHASMVYIGFRVMFTHVVILERMWFWGVCC